MQHYWRENGVVKASPTYESWRKMKARCRRPSNNRYYNYGARGITYPPEWELFAGFLADMGVRPEGTTLDRVRGKENYSKANCRWATATTQSRNRACVKLTESLVRQIRLLSSMNYKGHTLDKMFGLSRGMTGKILRGECWK